MEGKTHTWFTVKVILCFWSQDSVNRLEIKTKKQNKTIPYKGTAVCIYECNVYVSVLHVANILGYCCVFYTYMQIVL